MQWSLRIREIVLLPIIYSSDESAEGPSFIDCEGAQPYLFEPYDSDASSSTDSSNDSGERQYE